MSISVPAKGWYLEVDDSSSNTLFPRVLSSPTWKASVNGLPQVDIPVPRDDKWTDDVLEDATVRLFRDGEQLPIDSLATTREEQAQGQAQTVLECIGGRELVESDVEKEYNQQEIHLAAENLIQNNTTYTDNVDTPPNTREDSVDQINPDTTAELESNLRSPIPDDVPVAINNGEFQLQQSLHLQEAENPDTGTLQSTVNDSSYSDGTAAEIGSSVDDPEYNFDTKYIWAEAEVAVAFRIDITNAFQHEGFDVLLDGNTVFSVNADTLTNGLRWENEFANLGTDLSPGTHTVKVTGTTNNYSAPDNVKVDVVALYDNQYSYNFDNTVDSNGYLSGPELYPPSDSTTAQRFLADDMIRSVAGATISTTTNDGNNVSKLELSNDNGQTFPASATDSSSLDHDFSSLGANVDARITLERFGSRSTATPTSGYKGQAVDSFDLDADLSGTPLIVDERIEGSLDDVLKTLADRADQVWEVQHDGSGLTVEWTTPGQRNSDATPDVIDYRSSKRAGPQHVYEEATVIGSNSNVSNEQFTSDHGNAVDLNQDRLVAGHESVYESSSGENFERDVDYELDLINGTITVLASGAMADSTTYEIDYRYSTRNTWTKSGVGSPNTLTRRIGDLPSDRACGQAARLLVDELDSPIVEATITVPRTETNISPIEDLNPDIVPTDDSRVRIAQITHSPEQIVIKLRNRQTVEEAVDSIRDQINAVKTRV